MTNSRAAGGLLEGWVRIRTKARIYRKTEIKKGGMHLSVGVTGLRLSTSLPPFSKMKWLRFVLPFSLAPRAAMRRRLGSEMRG